MYGPHVSRYHAKGKRPTMAAHIEAARREAEVEAGFAVRAVSLFVGGPQDRHITLTPAEAVGLKKYLTSSGIRAIAHSAYSAVPWRGDPDAAAFIREEARVCQAAGITGLVVHLPKQPVAAVMKYLARLVEPEAPDVRVYLETPAVTPRETYYETPKKLKALFSAIRAELDPELVWFGLCADTAHLWTCGVDLRSYAAAAEWLAGLEAVAAVLPPDRVMFHLNDSRRPRGVGPDAHAPLAAGRIWEDHRADLTASGLAAVVDYAARHDTVCILERKPKEALAGDYRLLRDLGVGDL